MTDTSSRLAKEIEDILGRHSAETGSRTPDFILAHYLMMCLESFDKTVEWREKWYETNAEKKP